MKASVGTVLSFTLLFIGGAASAATIAWEEPKTIADDKDVSTTGTLVYAYNAGDTEDAVVNDVTFKVWNTATSEDGHAAANFSVLDTNHFGVPFGSTAAPFATLSAGYQTLLRSGFWSGTAVEGSVTFNDLTAGKKYLVQVWVNDSRTFGGTRSATANGSGSLKYNANGEVAGGLGQYVVGTFTADETSQTITFNPDVAPQLNAIQLRAIDGNGGK